MNEVADGCNLSYIICLLFRYKLGLGFSALFKLFVGDEDVEYGVESPADFSDETIRVTMRIATIGAQRFRADLQYKPIQRTLFFGPREKGELKANSGQNRYE